MRQKGRGKRVGGGRGEKRDDGIGVKSRELLPSKKKKGRTKNRSEERSSGSRVKKIQEIEKRGRAKEKKNGRRTKKSESALVKGKGRPQGERGKGVIGQSGTKRRNARLSESDRGKKMKLSRRGAMEKKKEEKKRCR